MLKNKMFQFERSNKQKTASQFQNKYQALFTLFAEIFTNIWPLIVQSTVERAHQDTKPYHSTNNSKHSYLSEWVPRQTNEIKFAPHRNEYINKSLN